MFTAEEILNHFASATSKCCTQSPITIEWKQQWVFVERLRVGSVLMALTHRCLLVRCVPEDWNLSPLR